MATSPQYDIYYSLNADTPSITRTLTDEDGAALDVSTATVTFIIEEPDGTDHDTFSCSNVGDGTDGEVAFTPDAVFSATGSFRAKYKVVYSGGQVEFVPSNRWMSVRVTDAPVTD